MEDSSLLRGFPAFILLLAAALIFKYFVSAFLAGVFGWGFRDGPLKGNIFATFITSFMFVAAVCIFPGAYFGDDRFSLYGYILLTLAAVLLSTFSSFWVYSEEMDLLREENMKSWIMKLAGGAAVSLLSFFAAAFACVFAYISLQYNGGFF